MFDFDNLPHFVIPVTSAILGIVTLISLGVSIWTVRRANRMGFDLARLMMLRDLSIRNSILSELPPDERARIAMLLDQAIADGGKVWEAQHLPILLGDKDTQRLLHARLGESQS